MQTIDEAREHCRFGGSAGRLAPPFGGSESASYQAARRDARCPSWLERKTAMKKALMMLLLAVARIAAANVDADVPVVKMSDLTEEIDMRNMLKMPVGKIFSVDLHVADESSLAKTSQIEIPRRCSEGAACDALRVSHVIIDSRTKTILGAMGSNVYPTTADGNFALTNQIHAAVAEISGGKAIVYPHQFSKDRKLCWVRYVWKPDPDKKEERELYVKCFCTPKRQLCMGTLLHTVGDGIHAGIADIRPAGTAFPVQPF